MFTTEDARPMDRKINCPWPWPGAFCFSDLVLVLRSFTQSSLSSQSEVLLVYSHSMVLGGFEETSYTTRFTPRTSLVIRDETRARKSCGRRAQSAVIPSVEVTARRATVFS